MTGARRTVRVSRDLFDELDRVLGPERGPNGEPSVNDFLTIDLLAIIESFATRFDSLPTVTLRHHTRTEYSYAGSANSTTP